MVLCYLYKKGHTGIVLPADNAFLVSGQDLFDVPTFIGDTMSYTADRG